MPRCSNCKRAVTDKGDPAARSRSWRPERAYWRGLARFPCGARWPPTLIGVQAPAAVVPYDEAWPAAFQEIASRLRRGLPDNVTIEHVGSTSVPGLAAKPIIDIDVVMDTPEAIPGVISRLEELGYLHRGDLGISGREAFATPAGLPYHHLYLVVEGSPPHRDHIDLRDFLRTHPGAATRYAEVKAQAAHLLVLDREAYVAAKSATVLDLLAEARRG